MVSEADDGLIGLQFFRIWIKKKATQKDKLVTYENTGGKAQSTEMSPHF